MAPAGTLLSHHTLPTERNTYVSTFTEAHDPRWFVRRAHQRRGSVRKAWASGVLPDDRLDRRVNQGEQRIDGNFRALERVP